MIFGADDTAIGAAWYDSPSSSGSGAPGRNGASATATESAPARGWTDREVSNWWDVGRRGRLETAADDLPPKMGVVGREQVTGVCIDAAGEPRAPRAEEPEESEAERKGQQANELRTRLLMREFALKDLSPEERARLALVTERVRVLLPNITQADFDVLDEMEQRQARRRAEVDAIWEALGLDK